MAESPAVCLGLPGRCPRAHCRLLFSWCWGSWNRHWGRCQSCIDHVCCTVSHPLVACGCCKASFGSVALLLPTSPRAAPKLLLTCLLCSLLWLSCNTGTTQVRIWPVPTACECAATCLSCLSLPRQPSLPSSALLVLFECWNLHSRSWWLPAWMHFAFNSYSSISDHNPVSAPPKVPSSPSWVVQLSLRELRGVDPLGVEWTTLSFPGSLP